MPREKFFALLEDQMPEIAEEVEALYDEAYGEDMGLEEEMPMEGEEMAEEELMLDADLELEEDLEEIPRAKRA
jgi:hypothetical protein